MLVEELIPLSFKGKFVAFPQTVISIRLLIWLFVVSVLGRGRVGVRGIVAEGWDLNKIYMQTRALARKLQLDEIPWLCRPFSPAASAIA